MQSLYYTLLDNARRLALPLLALVAVLFIGDAGIAGTLKLVGLAFSLSIVCANIAVYSFNSREFHDERALAQIYTAVCILISVVIAGVYFAQLG